MEKPFSITFSNGAIALAATVNSEIDLISLLREMGLHRHRPVLVVVGGANKLSDEDFARIRFLFLEVLAPVAQKWGATVIDGGTDVGVMRLMGEARRAIEGTFPLVGVVPQQLAILPGQSANSADAAPLEPNHTHFLLIPGDVWGDESVWIAEAATLLAQIDDSVTLLVNGGEVAWQDARESVKADRAVVVVAGSGRTADALAAALEGRLTDKRAEKLVASGLVQAIDLDAEVDSLTKIIEDIFAAQSPSAVLQE
jgi:hypothetical protein